MVILKRFVVFHNFKVKFYAYELAKSIFLINNRRLLQSLASFELKIEKDIAEKVIYSSVHPKPNFIQIKKKERRELKERINNNKKPIPLSIQFLNDLPETNMVVEDESLQGPMDQNFTSLPFKKTVINIHDTSQNRNLQNNLDNNKDFSSVSYLNEILSDGHTRSSRQWMNDYEKYSGEEEPDTFLFQNWKFDYGSADPSIPVSSVPCGGCGALLHCQDFSIPGYLPKEIFGECSEKDLRALKCQRCHFLENYNTALNVNVDSNSYPTLLSRIQDMNALIILLVDLTDFPLSLWPGIIDIVGPKKPIFLVGNKVDLLWGDSKGWMDHVKNVLHSALKKSANIKHVCLISAKTGYGVEEMINKLHTIWQYKGDVYLIGCTNVGKSTLFNSLLQSDYCKVKAIDLIQRATTAPWPGTTLNLLKFPILRPEGWRLYLRTLRLKNENKQFMAERKLAVEQRKAFKIKTPVQLIGHIGRTFKEEASPKEIDVDDAFSIPNLKQAREVKFKGSGLDPNDKDFVKSKWVYDTPGVLHKDQILDILTTEELTITLPKSVIVPRTYNMKPEWTIFIGGLARVDYLKGEESIKFTIFASSNLPVTICNVTDADDIYYSLLRTDYFKVPQPIEHRLSDWPNLEKGQEFSLCGVNDKISCADILLSSTGWIAVTPKEKQICRFVAWTPYQRGIHIRCPPLLPFAVSLRGKKFSRSPAYAKSKYY